MERALACSGNHLTRLTVSGEDLQLSRKPRGLFEAC